MEGAYRMPGREVGLALLGLFVLAGCASVDLSAGFPEVSAAVEERYAARIVWNPSTELDKEAAEKLRSLLQRKLTGDDAVQIALLSNRDLQAIYADLGVAQADLVQAGLFRNPVLDAAVAFHLGPVRPDLQFGVVFSVLDALYVPLRKRVAAARFEEAKLRVTGAVLDSVLQVRAAFYEHQANEQLQELRQTVVRALAASFEVSRRLHDAGNITDLDLARDRAAMEASKIELRSAEVTARQSRERLNSLMGLSGSETEWEIEQRLPDIAADPPEVKDIERSAVARSIDLAHARQRLTSAGRQLGYDRAAALIPATELGVGAEKESDEPWGVGPSVTIPIPVFDQGQARVARAATELRRAQQEYYALAVRIRATARAVRERLRGAQDRALYYRDIVLPLQERIVNEAQLQYNAMQIGIFQLLRDRGQQIEAGVAYVEALREYWVARAELVHVSSGRLPISSGFRAAGAGGKTKAKESENGD
jgi:cobalt-zinc-cadmium efflux system outer membrane protein